MPRKRIIFSNSKILTLNLLFIVGETLLGNGWGLRYSLLQTNKEISSDFCSFRNTVTVKNTVTWSNGAYVKNIIPLITIKFFLIAFLVYQLHIKFKNSQRNFWMYFKFLWHKLLNLSENQYLQVMLLSTTSGESLLEYIYKPVFKH